jgi:hypothetical protein
MGMDWRSGSEWAARFLAANRGLRLTHGALDLAQNVARSLEVVAVRAVRGRAGDLLAGVPEPLEGVEFSLSIEIEVG